MPGPRCPGTGSSCPRASAPARRACARCSTACSKTGCSTNPRPCISRWNRAPRRGSAPCGSRPATAPGCAAPLQALEAAGRPVTRIVPEFAPAGDAAARSPSATPSSRWLVAPARDGVLDAAADRGHAALAAGAARRHAARGRARPSPRWPNRCCSTRPRCSRRRSAGCRPRARRWDLAQFDFASSGRARALQEARHRLGRRAARRRSGGRALGRGAAGRRSTWSASTPGPGRSAPRSTTKREAVRAHPDADLPAGAGGGRRAGADGARGRGAAPADRRRLGARPRSDAGRAGRSLPRRPHAAQRLDYSAGQLRAAGPGAVGRRSCAASPPHLRARATPPRRRRPAAGARGGRPMKPAAGPAGALGTRSRRANRRWWRRRRAGALALLWWVALAPALARCAPPTRSTARSTRSCSRCGACRRRPRPAGAARARTATKRMRRWRPRCASSSAPSARYGHRRRPRHRHAGQHAGRRAGPVADAGAQQCARDAGRGAASPATRPAAGTARWS